MNSGKFFLGILAGAATGALLGVLYAPNKGSRTRRQILDKGDDFSESLKQKMNDFVNDINKKYASTIHEIENVVAKGKTSYLNTMEEAEKLVSSKKLLDGEAK